MAIHSAVGSNALKPRQSTLEATRIPAPSAGIDARSSFALMSPDSAILSYNLIGSEHGMLLRKGYREWALGCEEVADKSSGINTLIPFDGVVAGQADDRMFAVTNEGIWDVTTSNVPPVLKATFTTQTEGAGFGVYCHYVDQSGSSFLLYADALNGLWEYAEKTDLWIRPKGILGPDINHVAFVVVHKQRLWLVEENSTDGWYLPVASKSGQATQFYFGAKFPHGGRLRGLFNWSVDGGAGMDDYLVAISSAGDVIPYQGSDPSTADSWSAVGTYYVGRVPRGRSFTGEYAGDLYILCAYGLIAMSDLLQGVDLYGDKAVNSLAYKISRPIRQMMNESREKYGWRPRFMPAQGILLITSPTALNKPAEQWTLSLATQAWGKWRGVPLISAEEWHGEVYFGDIDSAVHVMDGYRDKALLDDADDAASGVPIEFSIMTSYQDYGSPAQMKIPQYIRADFWSTSPPTYATKMLFDYDITEKASVYAPPVTIIGSQIWDTVLWDEAIWSIAGKGKGHNSIAGAAGMGRMMAIALKGESSVLVALFSFDVMWKAGGPL